MLWLAYALGVKASFDEINDTQGKCTHLGFSLFPTRLDGPKEKLVTIYYYGPCFYIKQESGLSTGLWQCLITHCPGTSDRDYGRVGQS